jgi:hypothetical protein
MSRTTRLTGYAARTDLAEGLALTWAWYRNVFEGAGISAV